MDLDAIQKKLGHYRILQGVSVLAVFVIAGVAVNAAYDALKRPSNLITPSLACDTANFDIGNIAARDARFTHVFILTNVSNHKLRITKISPSCRCTSITTDKKVLMPNEEAHLTAQVDWRDRSGWQAATICVTTDEGPNGTGIVTVDGTPVSSIGMSPTRMHFVKLLPGEIRSEILRISQSQIGPKLKITRIWSSSSRIVITKLDVNVTDEWGQYRVTVEGSPDAGESIETIHVLTSDGFDYHVPVEIKSIGSLTAFPNSLLFRVTNGSPSCIATIRVVVHDSNGSRSSPSIFAATPDGVDVKLQSQVAAIADAEAYDLTFRLGQHHAGITAGSIRLQSGVATLQLPVTAITDN